MGNVILHAFNWKFKEIEKQAKEISSFGYSAILISPPTFSQGKEWFYRYQPLDYRVIFSPLGNLQELTSLIQTLKKNNLKIYIDVVFNHMAHRRDDNLDFPGKDILDQYQQDPVFARNRLYGDLSKDIFSAEDFSHKTDTGLSDLDPDSQRVISAQKEYLRALKKIGADGFRIDAAKHMSIEHIKKVFTEEITRGLYIFAEIIPELHRIFLKDFLKRVDFSVYDFNLFYSMRKALSIEGSLEALKEPDQLDRFRSLTFAITHDIPNNQEMRQLIFDSNDPNRIDEKIAYAYIIGRDGGVPLVYSDKGKEGGMHSDQWKDAYKSKDLLKMIKFHNLLSGKTMQIVSAGKCHLIFSREGDGIAVFNKCTESIQVEVDSRTIQGKFINIDNNKKKFNIVTDNYSFNLPPRSFQLFLRQT
ncbi:MAG: alpha-amylase [Candidatus Omnitrophica bacterium]|nr:alpha-amylase [Candidatus Omnitrophota bacterium]